MDSVWQSALVVLQAFQLAFLLVHDWIPLGPLNDVRAVRRENAVRLLVIGTAVSSAPVALALSLSLHYFGHPYPAWVRVWLWLTYGLLFIGELEAWWIPYLFRSDEKRRARYQAMFGNTHAFLPERNGIVPNTLHVSLHAATLATLLVLTQLNGTARRQGDSPPWVPALITPQRSEVETEWPLRNPLKHVPPAISPVSTPTKP